jgi:hypothetical protein
MSFALAFVAAGLAFSAARVFVTSPGALTTVWILLVCKTPKVGPIQRARAQLLGRRILVPKCLKESERELDGVESLLGES